MHDNYEIFSFNHPFPLFAKAKKPLLSAPRGYAAKGGRTRTNHSRWKKSRLAISRSYLLFLQILWRMSISRKGEGKGGLDLTLQISYRTYSFCAHSCVCANLKCLFFYFLPSASFNYPLLISSYLLNKCEGERESDSLWRRRGQTGSAHRGFANFLHQ